MDRLYIENVCNFLNNTSGNITIGEVKFLVENYLQTDLVEQDIEEEFELRFVDLQNEIQNDLQFDFYYEIVAIARSVKNV